MERKSRRQGNWHLFLAVVWMLLFGMGIFSPTSAFAASKPAQITECRLISAGRIRITVEVENPQKLQGKKCSLFAETLSQSKLTASAKPIQSKNKARKITFTISLKQNTSSSRLFFQKELVFGQYEFPNL